MYEEYKEKLIDENYIQRFNNVIKISSDFSKEWVGGVTKATSNNKNPDPFYWAYYYLQNKEDLNLFLERVMNQGHYIPFEFINKSSIYMEGTKALMSYIWAHINVLKRISLGGLELSLRRVSINKSQFLNLNKNLADFVNNALIFYNNRKKLNIRREEARKILPSNVITYLSLFYDYRSLLRLSKLLLNKNLPEEFNSKGKSLEKLLRSDLDLDIKDEEIEAVNFDFKGNLKTHNIVDVIDNNNIVGNLSYLSLCQLIRSRLLSVDNLTFTDLVQTPFSKSNELVQLKEYDNLLLEWKDTFQKLDDELKIYGILLGQVVSFNLKYVDEEALNYFYKARYCMTAQSEIRTFAYELGKILNKNLLTNKKFKPKCDTCKEKLKEKTKGYCAKELPLTTIEVSKQLKDFYKNN